MRSARVILVRHVDTTWSECGRLQGSQDPPLSERGRARLDRLARFVARLAGGDRLLVLSSPLRRAACTAESIAMALGVSVQKADELREVSLGQWEGMLEKDIAMSGAERRAWEVLDPEWSWGGNGDRIATRVAATERFLSGMVSGSDVDLLIAVSHGLLIQGLLANWILSDIRNAATISVPLGSVSEVRLVNGKFEAVFVGRTADHATGSVDT